HRGDGAAERFGHGFAREFVEFGFRIKKIEVTGAAFHEEPDDGFCFGREMGRFGREGIKGRRFGGARAKAVETEQIAESEGAEAATGALQKFAAGMHGADVRTARHKLASIVYSTFRFKSNWEARQSTRGKFNRRKQRTDQEIKIRGIGKCVSSVSCPAINKAFENPGT